MRTISHSFLQGSATAWAVSVALAPAAAAQSSQNARTPEPRDAAEHAQRPRDPDTAPVVEFVTVSKPDGFDWRDAGLGAASGIGLVLIGAGTAMTTARMRRRSVGAGRP